MADSARDNRVRVDRIEICIGCGESSFTNDYTRGENICTSCGLVVSERTADRGPEWRAFTSEERKARERTGAPMRLSIADKGLSTMIDWRGKDANGRTLTSNTRAAIYRMRKWQIRSSIFNSQYRSLGIAMSELERLSSQLGIPRDARETAALIYRKALAKRLIRGKGIESVVAAAIYLACRIHRIPRRLGEVVSEAKTNRKQIAYAVRMIITRVDVDVPLASAEDLIPRMSSDLGLEGRTMKKATEIIKRAKKNRITMGKDPGGIAAAALYIAGILEEDRRTQREISKVSRVTEVTIRNRYKGIVRSLGISLDTDL